MLVSRQGNPVLCAGVPDAISTHNHRFPPRQFTAADSSSSLFLHQQGKAVALGVERDDLIEDVKRQIEEKETIPPYQQRLFFSRMDKKTRLNIQLENGHTLPDYDIQKESLLHMVRRVGTMEI